MRGLINLAIIAAVIASLYGPVSRALTVLGVFRTSTPAALAENQGFFKIADTVHCEDLHHYGDKLYAACEDSAETRYKWFPPMEVFTRRPRTTGSIHVIDPKTMKSSRLTFENFSGPFVTHGIDIIPDPDRKDAVYIFAVNHLPNPEYYNDTSPEAEDVPKARSQIELFHHILDSTSIKHIRSILDPLIHTPNDIFAESLRSFFVTNDHFYRGGFRRTIEDALPTAKWSSIIHVQLSSLIPESGDARSGISAKIALAELHNNNGLAHGKSDDEMVISSAIGGRLFRANVFKGNHSISVVDDVPVDSIADNPSYFRDPFKTKDDDRSGYLVAGLSRGIDLPMTFTDPNAKDGVMVWFVRPGVGDGVWEKRLIFEDDGELIRTASAAVLVPGEKKRMGWLFVTGFLSESVVAVEVEV